MSNNFSIDIHLDVYEPISFKLVKNVDAVELLILMLVLSDLDVDCRPPGCVEAKTSGPII